MSDDDEEIYVYTLYFGQERAYSNSSLQVAAESLRFEIESCGLDAVGKKFSIKVERWTRRRYKRLPNWDG